MENISNFYILLLITEKTKLITVGIRPLFHEKDQTRTEQSTHYFTIDPRILRNGTDKVTLNIIDINTDVSWAIWIVTVYTE